MEDNKEVVTEPVEETKSEDKSLEAFNGTNKDVANMVAKAGKEAVEKMLKDLGVEDAKSAKEGLKKFNELQEAQKTDLQKAIDRAEKAEQQNAIYESKIKDREAVDSIESILREKEIDTKYAKTIKKLIGEVEEITEELVTKTINDELPMLISDTQIKIGVEKKEEKPKSSISSHLDDKYGKNFFYKPNNNK